MIGHLQLPAERLHRPEIRLLPAEAGIQGDGREGEGEGVKAAQFGQENQQGQAVLAAGHPHRDPILFPNHAVPLHGRAQRSQ